MKYLVALLFYEDGDDDDEEEEDDDDDDDDDNGDDNDDDNDDDYFTVEVSCDNPLRPIVHKTSGGGRDPIIWVNGSSLSS